MEVDRYKWNQKFRAKPESWTTPDEFLPQAYERFVRPRFPSGGLALDLAGGLGRHGLWLARQGWRVELLDGSDHAVETVNAQAKSEGLSLEARLVDLLSEPLPAARYDVVMVFLFLNRMLFPAIEAALKPGGLLLYKTYTVAQLKRQSGPSHPSALLSVGELEHAFPRMRTLHYHEDDDGKKAFAELVAEKHL